MQGEGGYIEAKNEFGFRACEVVVTDHLILEHLDCERDADSLLI